MLVENGIRYLSPFLRYLHSLQNDELVRSAHTKFHSVAKAGKENLHIFQVMP